MNVLVYTSLFPNTVQPWHGIFIRQRVAYFASRGHRVTVIAPLVYAPGWAKLRRWQEVRHVAFEEELDGLRVYHPRYFLLPKVSMPLHGLLMYAGSVACAERLHAAENFDCIDAHYVYPDGFAATMLGRHLGIPVVVSARGTDITLFPRFRLIRPMIQWTLRDAAGVIAVSGALNQAIQKLGVAPEKIATVGNGVDPRRFHPVDRLCARQKLGIAKDSRVILSVGHLVPVKGHAYLIRAIAQVARVEPRIQLHLVGDGELREKLEALAKSEGVADRVFFVGRRPNEEMKHWYSAADVSCLASSREGWANVLLESLACGTPVLATRVGGTPEVIVSDELGLLVEQSAETLAEGLKHALQKHWNRDAMVCYAGTRTWEVVAQEVESFFKACVLSRHEAATEMMHA